MEQPASPTKKIQLTPLTAEQHALSTPPKRTTDLPFFYLTKKKELLQQPINFEGTDEAGRLIRWKVSPNTIIGAPAIDAHRIWHQLIVPTIEIYRTSSGRVPEILPLGGVRKCLRALDWTEGGRQARQLLTGLNRIASAWCEVDFIISIQDTTGKEQLVPIKGKFSRLSIYAIGEKHLTDADLASGKFDFDFDLDATLYLQLHRLEVAVQENLEHRYIDNQYMFSVEPTGRRWLEIMGPKIFGVVKNRGTHCEIRYSWYVKHHHTLKRLNARFRIVEQMNSVVDDHIKFGYILKPEYRAVKEPGKEIDFIIRYSPGPMARESTARIRAHLRHETAPQISEQTNLEKSAASRPRQRRLKLEAASEPATPAPIIDYNVVAELGKRGVGDADARQILASLPSGQPVLDQLEYGDAQIEQSRGKITNPPGFYISLLQRNVPVPSTFETSRARKARQEAEILRSKAIADESLAREMAEQQEVTDLQAKFDQLPEDDRLALLSQVKAEQLAKTPQMAQFLKTNPEADSFLMAGARKKLKEGWTPPQPAPQLEETHYAINSLIRQATPLQESAPVLNPTQPGQGSDLQSVAPEPQSENAKIRLQLEAANADVLNLKAILATLQLKAPNVEQPIVKPDLPSIDDTKT